jgi:integrase
VQISVKVEGIKVSTFLESIGRNSWNSERAYRVGLNHFAHFLQPLRQTPDTIIPLLTKGKFNTYELLDQFVSYLTKKGVRPQSLKVHLSVIRSFLEYSDIEISNAKFKKRVKVPKYYPDQEEPLTLTDIRQLLEYNSNHRLRTYLLLLVSSGLRATEACSLRVQDVDFSVNPIRITTRREYSKTKRIRTIYCSDEAATHLRKLIKMHSPKQPQDLIFAMDDGKNPRSLYTRLLEQFQKLQHMTEKDTRKENSLRRKITIHSLRRTAFSIINEQTNSEFANWFLGHHHSVYWTHNEQERREIYRTKCMPFLTIYQETRDSSIEAALREKDMTIRLLTNRIADIEFQQKEQSEILKNLTPEILEKIING